MVPLPVMVTSVLVAYVDEGGGPGHLDAGDAGGEFGVVFESLRADEGDAFGDVEGDAGFEEEGAGEVGSGFEGDGAFGLGCGVDGFLDGGGVEGGAVGFGSVVVGEKYFLLGVREGGGEGEEEGEGELWRVLFEATCCGGHDTSPSRGIVAQSLRRRDFRFVLLVVRVSR